MANFPDWVKIGKNSVIEENVRLGVGREELGDLIIGDDCKIRSGSVIYRGAKLGNNCQTGHNVLIREHNKIGDYTCIGSFSEIAPHNSIGSYVSIHSQCFLEEVVLGDFVFVAPGVKFLDDLYPIDPDAKNYKGAEVGNDVAIGGGSVILPKIKIGNKVLIGSGSVVTKNIPDGEVWAGNPARFLKNIDKIMYPGSNEPYIPGTRRRYNK